MHYESFFFVKTLDVEEAKKQVFEFMKYFGNDENGIFRWDYYDVIDIKQIKDYRVKLCCHHQLYESQLRHHLTTLRQIFTYTPNDIKRIGALCQSISEALQNETETFEYFTDISIYNLTSRRIYDFPSRTEQDSYLCVRVDVHR